MSTDISDASGGEEKGSDRLQHVVAGEDLDPPLIPAAGFFEGEVVVQGTTRIEGAVRGALRGRGRLAVGPGARIDGEVECDEVESHGLILGSLEAVGGVWLGPGSRCQGSIRAHTLVLEDTAIWDGEARVGPPKPGR